MTLFTTTRAPRRNRRNRRKQDRWGLTFWNSTLAGLAGIGALAGVGYYVWQDMNTIKPDKLGCYATGDIQAHTVALIDVSDPGFDVAQARDALTVFTNLFRKELKFNERFSMVSTAQSRIGSVSAPVVSLCGPAKSSADLKRVGAGGATQAYIDRQREQAFEKRLKPHLERIFATNPPDRDRQRYESPILEQIQSVSRMQGFGSGTAQRSLIVVSDLLQNTKEAQFCQKKGHLPKFTKFKNKPYFERIKPISLNNVTVKLYMLIRGGLGQLPYAYCSEEELRQFWIAYFKEDGVRNVDIIRLRRGGI